MAKVHYWVTVINAELAANVNFESHTALLCRTALIAICIPSI